MGCATAIHAALKAPERMSGLLLIQVHTGPWLHHIVHISNVD